MSEGTAKCSICHEQGKTKNAIIWCSECDEKLCNECNGHHSSSKLTVQHNTRTIEEYLTLPTFIIEMKQFCEEHGEKYQVFCKAHDCPCCRRCSLEEHRNCRDTVALEDIIENVKTSVCFQDIQKQLEELAENMAKIRIDSEDSVASIAQQRKQIETDISSMRRKINDYLDKLQEKLVKELVETEVQSNLQIQNIITTLKEKEAEIKDLQSNVANIKKYASDLQAFLSVKQIGASTMAYENYIQSLVDDQRITRAVISCKMEDIVLNLSSNMKKFGVINLDVKPGKINIGIEKHKQAQMMVAPLPSLPSLATENISVQLIKEIKPGCVNIRGCSFLSDGKMVLAANGTDKIFIVNKDGSLEFTVDVSVGPCDVACIDDDTVAVSYVTCYISIVSLQKRKVERQISVGSSVFGVTHNNGVLFCCSRSKGLLRISLKDSTPVSIIDLRLTNWSYLTTYNNNIYYTSSGTVTCCDMKGQVNWKLDSGLPGFLLGITVDNNGRVLVVGSKQVFVISPDGKRSKTIITNVDDPQTLHCDRGSNTLLIATRKENHFLYRIV